MTNRMILDDPQIGKAPNDARAWNALQRQLAEDTAPGYISRVLLENDLVHSTTYRTIEEFAIHLDASSKYYVSAFLGYNRQSSDNLKFQFIYSGTTPGYPENCGYAHYRDITPAEVISHQVDPFLAGGRAVRTTINNGYSFRCDFWMATTTEGTLDFQWAQNANSGVNDGRMYSGSHIIAQSITNLRDISNP